MRVIIVSGVIILFTFLSIAAAGVDSSEEWTMACVIIGPVAGAFAGFALLRLIGSNPRRRSPRRTPKPRPIASSSPFRQRLAKFTHQEEAEVMVETSYRSKMPFWVAVDFFTRVPPKSARLIRRILERIRQLAR